MPRGAGLPEPQPRSPFARATARTPVITNWTPSPRGGAGERGVPERHAPGRLALEGLRVLPLRRLRAGPLPVEHLEPDAEQEEPARDLERGHGDAERDKDPLADEAEHEEREQGDEAALLDHGPRVRGRGALRGGREEPDCA